MIAFLTAVAEKVGPGKSVFHLGATSSDILDTSLAILLREAADLLIADLVRLRAILKEKAFKYKNTLMIGRSTVSMGNRLPLDLRWRYGTKTSAAT